MKLYPRNGDPVPTFNWFKYQPIALEILTQQSRYKRAENNSLKVKKGPSNLGQLVVWGYTSILIHLLCIGIQFLKIKQLYKTNILGSVS